MQFNVSGLLREPVGATRRYHVEETFPPLEGVGVEEVKGEVKFTRTERGVWVHADLETWAPAVCSRCLEEFQQALHFSMDEEFFPTVDVLTGAPLPPPDPEEEAFTIDAHHVLDLQEAVRQYALLSLPMKPLCRADCRGLCPRCGANRNRGPCSCGEPQGDPRWEALRRLLNQE